MIKTLKPLITLAAMAALMAGQVMAHTTVLRKNTPDGWAERIELEGTSSLSATTISHGCSFGGSETKQVTAQAVVWPNGFDDIAVRSDTGAPVLLADEIIGNLVMGPKPVQDHNIFKRITVKTGDVPPYQSHGLRTSDIRAFHYTNGKLKTFLYGVVPYTASYPSFQAGSCATKLKIQFGIANYCTHTKNMNRDYRSDIWIGRLTPKFDDPDVVSVGFWPHVDVVRDMVNNPLPASCGNGYEIVVTPSDTSIDEFLPIRSYWPASSGRRGRRGNDD